MQKVCQYKPKPDFTLHEQCDTAKSKNADCTDRYESAKTVKQQLNTAQHLIVVCSADKKKSCFWNVHFCLYYILSYCKSR